MTPERSTSGVGRSPVEKNRWWQEPAFWEVFHDFIFPPEHVAAGEVTAAQVAALLGLEPGARVLDLGCGTGRIAVPLARRGLSVTGVDAQAGYLARARARAAAEGVPLALVEGDLSAVALPGNQDAALSIFTSLGYFEDPRADERILANAFAALRPGGRLVLEAAHRDGVVRLLAPREARTPDGRRFREEPAFDPVSGVLTARWTAWAAAGEARTFVTRMRPYPADRLDRMLARAGFVERTFVGGLDGGPVSLDRWTLAVLARRP